MSYRRDDRCTPSYGTAAGSSRARVRGTSDFDDYSSLERYHASSSGQQDHSQRHPSVGASRSRGSTPPFVMDDVPSSRPASYKSRSSSSSSASGQEYNSRFFRGRSNETSSGSSGSSGRPSYRSAHASSDEGIMFEASPRSRQSSPRHPPPLAPPVPGPSVQPDIPASGFSDQLTPGGYHFREGTDIHTRYRAYKRSSDQARECNEQYTNYMKSIPAKHNDSVNYSTKGAGLDRLYEKMTIDEHKDARHLVKQAYTHTKAAYKGRRDFNETFQALQEKRDLQRPERRGREGHLRAERETAASAIRLAEKHEEHVQYIVNQDASSPSSKGSSVSYRSR